MTRLSIAERLGKVGYRNQGRSRPIGQGNAFDVERQSEGIAFDAVDHELATESLGHLVYRDPLGEPRDAQKAKQGVREDRNLRRRPAPSS